MAHLFPGETVKPPSRPDTASLLALDAGTLSQRIASRTISCRELMQATLQRKRRR